jgi:hypothetical protein
MFFHLFGFCYVCYKFCSRYILEFTPFVQELFLPILERMLNKIKPLLLSETLHYLFVKFFGNFFVNARFLVSLFLRTICCNNSRSAFWLSGLVELLVFEVFSPVNDCVFDLFHKAVNCVSKAQSQNYCQ